VRDLSVYTLTIVNFRDLLVMAIQYVSDDLRY